MTSWRTNVAMVPNVFLPVPGRGKHSSGKRASMAAVQHQEPQQHIPSIDLAPCSEPEPFKASVWTGFEN